jgi:Tfp pilus assembly protein PilX
MHAIHSTRPDHAGVRWQDRGSAMILTLMVMTLVTVLSATVAVVTINNLQASWRARQAGAALSAADAGIAQAVTYLRSSGVRGLDCSPTCPSNPWGSSTTPASVTLPGAAGQSYKVWIKPVTPFPQNDPGVYQIHSTGSAAGAASRPVTAEVSVTRSDVPKGVFARSVSGGGSASVTNQSVFSTSCVNDRSKIAMNGFDLAYDGIPVGVHSSATITGSKGCTTTNSIHSARPCSTGYPYDQDRLGGRLTAGDGCYDPRMAASGPWAKYYSTYDTNGDGTKDVSSLLKSDADLFKIFGFQPELSQERIDSLRMLAQSQGNYWQSSSHWSSPDEANAVMFFDLAGTDTGGTVNLNDITGFGRDTNTSGTAPSCPSRSLIIVIEGGNAKLNSNQKLAASLILTGKSPNLGQLTKANGNATFIGTIFADTINLVGNVDITMDACFLANPSPGLMDFAVTSYREEDRGLG